MNIASFVISIFGIIISFITLIILIIKFVSHNSKITPAHHTTFQYFIDKNETFANLLFANTSLEPYSILRVDLVVDDTKEIIGIEQLLQNNETTFVKPRELMILYGIKLKYKKEFYDNFKKQCIIIFTTIRRKPYKINLKFNDNESILTESKR